MIEINLIPDIKQDLIKARRVRTVVISSAITVGVIAVGIVALLAVYLFGIQTLRSTLADNSIKDNEAKLRQVPDLANILTIQSQLASISSLHDNKTMSSRLYELLTIINPADPNKVTFSRVTVDTKDKTIRLEGQAASGFIAADVLKKTILSTTLNYSQKNTTKKEPLTDSVSISNLSYGENSRGARVLRFAIDFEYSKTLFARNATSLVIARPEPQNATDSYKYLPESLFSARAEDEEGAQ